MKDADVWASAFADSRLLITTDRGFTEYRTVSHHGIVIVRLRQPNRCKIHHAVMLAIGRLQEEEWTGLLVVVRDSTLSVSRSGGPVERL
jgi:hypothetical protein